MNDSKNHKAAAEPPLDCNVRGSNRVSMGRNPNTHDCCGYPKCSHLKVDGDKAFGWCQHPDNRVDDGRLGFTPSVSFTGYCDHHTARYP